MRSVPSSRVSFYIFYVFSLIHRWQDIAFLYHLVSLRQLFVVILFQYFWPPRKWWVWECCTANSNHHFTHNRRLIKCPDKGLRFSLGLCSNVWEFTLVYMQEHMAKHFSLLRYSCPVCNKSFSKLGHLNMHIRIHRGTKEYSCIHCGKIFVNMNLLRTHIQSHMVQRPYMCGFCGCGFFRPRDKVEHECIHTGEKPYSCTVCGMRFWVRYCLSHHMRWHTDVRLYSCKVCGKTFWTGTAFKAHTKIHLDERTYKYVQLSALLIHFCFFN